MNSQLHPDGNVLQSLAARRLPEGKTAEVRQHVEQCPECQEALNAMGGITEACCPADDAVDLGAGAVIGNRTVPGGRHAWKRTSSFIGYSALSRRGCSNWLIQRLPTRTRQEIEKMLVGELPELVETRAGQDLIEIGEKRGRADGLVESVGIVLEAKRGRLSKSLRQRVRKLKPDQLRQLLAEAATRESSQSLNAWLTEHGQ